MNRISAGWLAAALGLIFGLVLIILLIVWLVGGVRV